MKIFRGRSSNPNEPEFTVIYNPHVSRFTISCIYIPAVEHDHENITGSVLDSHHDRSVSIVILQVQVYSRHGYKTSCCSLL